jgi:methionine aminopeptidase
MLMMVHIFDFSYNYFSKLAYFYGYYVVDRFVGHGIGPIWHSEPLILHHGEYVDISLLL